MPPPELYRTYFLARRWRWFFCLIAPPLIALFIGLPASVLLRPQPVEVFLVLCCLLPFGLATIFLYGLAEAIWGHITITPDGVVQASIFGRRQLAWVEIKGYAFDRNYLRLLPTNTLKRPVKIGLLTERMADIIDWVAEYYPDLTPRPAASQADVPFATPEAQSNQTTQQTEAQQTARLLNLGSWLATAWLLFLPTPYSMAVLACLLLPLAAMAAQWLYPGLLRADEPDAAPAPSLAVSLLIPGVGLFIRLLLDAELVSTAAIQPWAYPVGGGFALLLLATNRKQLFGQNGDGSPIGIMLTAALVYGYSAPVAYNVAFDTGKPTYYKPVLLRKYINNDELPGFNAVVQPWGPFLDSAAVPVSKAHYQQLRPGRRVWVRLMPGALGVRWFRVVE